MARIEVRTHVAAAPQVVWDVLVDWEGQPRWMVDAHRVEVRSPQREGIGVLVRAPTSVFGVTVTDEMAVIEWEPPRVLGVRHTGRIIRGHGALELEPTPHGTLLTWWEEVDVPLGAAGDAVVEVLIVPWIRRVFRRSVANLKRICESASVRP